MIEAPPGPPRPDELEALIREARARHRRRRIAFAAGVALAAATGLGIYALASGRNPARKVEIPRVGGAVSLCRSSQLTASAGTQALNFAQAIAVATITNGSASSCSLPTARPVVALSIQGNPVQMRQTGWPYRFTHRAVAHVLVPGRSARIYIEENSWCGKRAWATLNLRFRGGVSVVSSQRLGRSPCVPGLPPAPLFYVSPPYAPH